MSRPKTPVSEYKKLMLRLPEEVLEACSELAETHRRSMNAQIVHVLEQWIAQEQRRSHVQSKDDHPASSLLATAAP